MLERKINHFDEITFFKIHLPQFIVNIRVEKLFETFTNMIETL